MGLGDMLKGLFSGGGASAKPAEIEATEHKGFMIRPEPEKRGSQYGTAGTVTKAFPDGVKEHRFIRADTHSSLDEAIRFSVQKGQQIVDEQGDRLFN